MFKTQNTNLKRKHCIIYYVHNAHPQGDTVDAMTFGTVVGTEMLLSVRPSASWPWNEQHKSIESLKKNSQWNSWQATVLIWSKCCMFENNEANNTTSISLLDNSKENYFLKTYIELFCSTTISQCVDF